MDDKSTNPGFSVNIDEATVVGIIQKGIAELFTGKEKPNLEDAAMKKAVSDMAAEFTATVSKSVEEAVKKALEEKKPDEKKPDGKKEEDAKKEDATKKGMDESFTFAGVTITKSAVGDDAYNALVAMQKQIATAKHETMLKSLEVEVEKTYGNLPGTSREKAVLMAAINGLPAESSKLAKQYLEQANKSLGDTMLAKGDGTPSVDISKSAEAEQKIDALAKSIAEKQGVSYAEAYSKALESPEGTALYEQYLNR